MAIPYAFIKILKGEEPHLKVPGKSPREQAEFLLEGKNMKGQYLGACLDSCRWGSYSTIMYEMNINDMISFIQNWMEQNKRKFPKIWEKNFTELWHEKEIGDLDKRFELSYVHHEVCPRDKNHKDTIKDLGGRLRCYNFSKKKLKPSYIESYDSFDELSQTKQRHFYEKEPMDPIPDEDYAYDESRNFLYEEELKDYQEELEEFKNENPTFEVIDNCYAILSEKGRILPLETILKRLNLRPAYETFYCKYNSNDIIPGVCKRLNELDDIDRENYEFTERCPGHIRTHNYIEFPFGGWTLALYVQKWYEQSPDGKAPFFEKI